MVKKYNRTKIREDAYFKVGGLINVTSTVGLKAVLMNEDTTILLHCLAHIGGDQSKLENKKRVAVVNQLLK